MEGVKRVERPNLCLANTPNGTHFRVLRVSIGGTSTPRKAALSIACCTNPEALASSTNSLM